MAARTQNADKRALLCDDELIKMLMSFLRHFGIEFSSVAYRVLFRKSFVSGWRCDWPCEIMDLVSLNRDVNTTQQN